MLLSILVNVLVTFRVLSGIPAADVREKRRSSFLGLLSVQRLNQSSTLCDFCLQVLHLDGDKSHKVLDLLVTHNPVTKIYIQHIQRCPRD
jgi:hypothetical protein